MEIEKVIVFIFLTIIIVRMIYSFVCMLINIKHIQQFQKVNDLALKSFGLNNWLYKKQDDVVRLKSSKGVEDYTIIKYLKDNRANVKKVDNCLREKQSYANRLTAFLQSNDLKTMPQYIELERKLKKDLLNLDTFDVLVFYESSTGRSTKSKVLSISRKEINKIIADPSCLMTKTEYNQMLKAQNKEALAKKHQEYYEMVNEIIDLANDKRDTLEIESDKEALDRLIASLFDKTVNSIKKIKSLDSEEWSLIQKVIKGIKKDVLRIIENNQKILDYYNSDDFKKIKEMCNFLTETQKEFNDYISEKAKSISNLFGTSVIRNETINRDEYNYIRPYKKSVTPFTAEVSSTVFSSAENNPLDYIIKYFYPNKEQYPEQIQKLQLLIEELETLKEAREIIENYKKDYQKYLTEVPMYIMENDEAGFYSRLGFANISERELTVEYKFSYTSDGGMAHRFFTVPMTEETIIELIGRLQGKLTKTAFIKEQRNLMTRKLRQQIKERDNYTCKYCGNSTFTEPNLLLEIDHIIPVAKGGYTVEDNLQTLCWKCNRAKSSKIE